MFHDLYLTWYYIIYEKIYTIYYYEHYIYKHGENVRLYKKRENE